MTQIIPRYFSISLYVFLMSTPVFAQDAHTILQKMDQVLTAYKDKKANIKMVMTDMTTGKESVKEAILMQQGNNKKLFRYTAPKSDAGIASLSLPNGEVYLYLPLFKKPKKITNLAEKNVFNKSDFNLSDMSIISYAALYTPEFVKQDAKHYTLDLKPKTGNSNYSHIVVQIDKKNYYPVKFEYYDSKNQLVKISKYHFKQIKGYWVADVVSMQDVRKSHKTTIIFKDIEINTGLKDELFTVENMAKH